MADPKCNNSSSPRQTQLWRNLAAYWLLGLCNNYGYVVMLSAAHDVLSSDFGEGKTENTNSTHPSGNSTARVCNKMSTGAILLADILPSIFVKLVAPFLPFFVHIRVAIVILLSAAGFLLVALSTAQWIAIIGVVATSFASGLGELTFLAYTYGFDKNAISMWSSGTGGAGIFGAGSYAGLISLGLTPSNSLLIMLIVPVVMGLSFWLLLKHPTQLLESKMEAPEVSENVIENSQNVTSMEYIPKPAPQLTLLEKLRDVPPLFKYMLPLGSIYLLEYFINQGLFELIYFPDIWLDQKGIYRWLQLDYQIGVFISRSSASFIKLQNIWLMAVLQLINVILFTFEVLYFFSPTIWLVFLLVFWEGLLGGAAYVNTYYKVSKEVPLEKQEFSLSMTTVADAIGIGLAGALAIPVHNIICNLSRPA